MHTKFIIILIAVFFGTSAHAHAASLRTQFKDLIDGTGLQKTMQSACLSDGENTPLSYNADMRIIPASVSKLYTFDFALAKLPTDYHYTTTFYLNGTTLYINSGGDPQFVISNLRSVVQKIYNEKKVRINTFVFSPNFYFNWKSSKKDVQLSIFRSLKEDATLPIAKTIRVTPATTAYSGQGQKYEFQSVPLPTILKLTSNYSNNISADTIFNQLGGADAFAKYMKDTYDVDATTIQFKTGSGLSGNYTTCNLTLQVVQHLVETLEDKGLALTDVMTVPEIDPGVLQKRTININDVQSLVAKSGFVNNHHTLAGVINTKEGPAYFAIFTYFDDMKKSATTKNMIDAFTGKIIDYYRDILKSFKYTPNLAIFNNIKITRAI